MIEKPRRSGNIWGEFIYSSWTAVIIELESYLFLCSFANLHN